MTDVTVTNRRADSSANEDLTQLAHHGADAFGYKANLRIDRKLRFGSTRASITLSRYRSSNMAKDCGCCIPP
jgi:hypothetical protein